MANSDCASIPAFPAMIRSPHRPRRLRTAYLQLPVEKRAPDGTCPAGRFSGRLRHRRRSGRWSCYRELPVRQKWLPRAADIVHCKGERRGGACRLGRRRLKRGRPRRLESLPAALFVVGDTELAEHAVFGPYFQQKLLARADRRSTSQRFSCRSAPSRTGTLLRGQALRCRHVHGFPHPLRLRAAWNRSRTSWLF